MSEISAPSRGSHSGIDPAILYLGTPVVLAATSNLDGSTNLAPISSAWWLGWSCMLGLDATSHTVANLERTRERVLKPVGMDVRYIAKANSDVTCVADVTGPIDVSLRELTIAVHGITDDGVTVIEGSIQMKVSPPNPREESFDAIRNVR